MKTVLRFIKFEHTLFSLPLLYAGVFLVPPHQPSLKILILVLLAGIGARTFALSINRILDRHIDALNPRTRDRELPSGKLSLTQAWIVASVGLVLYLLSARALGSFCFKLSPIPLLIFTVYPLMKRFTSLCHLGVGLGLSMAPLGGWIAVTQSFSPLRGGILLSLFTFFWVSGFDIIYATLDEEFDRKHRIYSLVARWGRESALRISAFLHLIAWVVLFILWRIDLDSHPIAFLFLVITGIVLYLEQRWAEQVNLAFFTLNAWLGFFVLGMVLSAIYL